MSNWQEAAEKAAVQKYPDGKMTMVADQVASIHREGFLEGVAWSRANPPIRQGVRRAFTTGISRLANAFKFKKWINEFLRHRRPRR